MVFSLHLAKGKAQHGSSLDYRFRQVVIIIIIVLSMQIWKTEIKSSRIGFLCSKLFKAFNVPAHFTKGATH